MDFEILDRYLLEGSIAKADAVAQLLAQRSAAPERAVPFLRGLEMLGARTPDLALIALRLVLAGKTADDGSVVRLRDAASRARAEGGSAQAARAYREALE